MEKLCVRQSVLTGSKKETLGTLSKNPEKEAKKDEKKGLTGEGRSDIIIKLSARRTGVRSGAEDP